MKAEDVQTFTLKNGMKFRIAKKTAVILKSFVAQDLDACHGLIN